MKWLAPVVALAALAVVPAASAKTITLQVTSVGISVVTHDKAPKGTSKGDTVIYRDKLVNAKAQFGKKKGATVGSDSGTMTFTSPHAAHFRGVAVLPNGSLTLNGPVVALSNGDLAIPVTQGTKAYQGASGFLLVGPGKKRALNVYRLTIASGNVA